MVWHKDGEPIDLNDARYHVLHDAGRYQLKIYSANFSDQCEWKAVGENPFGKCDSVCKLKIMLPDTMRKPVFRVPLENVHITEGNVLRLEAKLDAEPAPEIIWYKEDMELEHGHHCRMMYDDDQKIYSITIIDTYTEDSGDYKCVASNPCGSASSICKVKIIGKNLVVEKFQMKL